MKWTHLLVSPEGVVLAKVWLAKTTGSAVIKLQPGVTRNHAEATASSKSIALRDDVEAGRWEVPFAYLFGREFLKEKARGAFIIENKDGSERGKR